MHSPYNAQYTPPTPTRRNCFVASASAVCTRIRKLATVSSCRRCEHTRRQSWPSLQFPVLRSDDIMTLLLKVIKFTNITLRTELIRMFTNMQSHMLVISYFYSIRCRIIVNWVTAIGCVHIAESVGTWQSSWASCEFMYTPQTPTRRNSTVSSRRRRRCVLGLNV